MRSIDELYHNYRFAGTQVLRDLLCQQGLAVGSRHIKTPMKKIGVKAMYCKPTFQP